MADKMFGEKLRQLRLERGLTLRKFCQITDLDPGLVSRWERGKENPPQSEERLNQIAAVLSLERGTEAYSDFKHAAALSAGHVPRSVMDDAELLGKLPVLFRTLDGKKLSDEKLDLLLRRLREEL